MRYLTKRHLSRRTVLRGVGAAIALPLLESMIPAGIRTASAAGAPRSRLACVYIPHGCVASRWTPAATGRDFEFTPTLRPLEPFRDRLTIVSGLKLPAAYVGESSAAANHGRSSQCWLTCEPEATGPSPASADQLAARAIGQETPLPSLELALEAGASVSYLTPTTPLPTETNPRVVFERLLGDGSTPEERAARQRQLSSLLDSVTGQVAGLERGLPGADRERLDRYLTDIRELERRLALAGDSPLATIDVPAKPNGIPADFEQHAMLMFDLLALAWQADLTRIATFMVARELSNRLYPKSGVNEGFHNASHHSEIPANIDRLAKLNEYHTRTTIAYFLGKLASTPDGDGTLLDHSLVLYGSGMGNPNQHDHNPLPMLLAGGGSGRLKGGRHLHAGVDTPFANLLVTVLGKLDVPVERFGDSTGALEV
ncbi:MAG TPA: DUF1552 domain-containing protein [Gammaproteobacteria bacterium]|nr:DUF1552 domain-containing protein [Gammaproteobacteria bacterium]